jgi:outer membrane protein, adhesin transport system
MNPVGFLKAIAMAAFTAAFSAFAAQAAPVPVESARLIAGPLFAEDMASVRDAAAAWPDGTVAVQPARKNTSDLRPQTTIQLTGKTLATSTIAVPSQPELPVEPVPFVSTSIALAERPLAVVESRGLIDFLPEIEAAEAQPSVPANPSPPVAQLVPVASNSSADKQGASGVTVIRPTRALETPPDVESLADAIEAAIKTNPEVGIAQAREDDARYGVREARAGYLPRVDLTAASGGEYNEPDAADATRQFRREASLTTRQLIWDFGLTMNEIRRARKAFESATEATKERVEDIALQIASAYVGVSQRQRIVELSRENVAAHQKILTIVATQKDLGLSTGADVSRVESQLARAQSALLDRVSEWEQSREGFRRLVNRLPGRLVEPPAPDAALPPDSDAAAQMIDTHSPRLKQEIAARQSIERQLASNKANYFPRLEVEVQGNYKNDVSGNTNQALDGRAMLVMRYNLFNGGADAAVSNRLRARIREQQFEVERVRREVEQDIRSDFSALRASRDKVEKISAEVKAANNVVTLYLEQFKTGKRSAFDLLESQQNAFTARSTQINNEYQALLSGYRVLQRLGLLFTTIAESQPPSADRKL